MIGRERELAELRGLLEVVAASGAGRVAVVEGEAGIGKSTLVAALAGVAGAAGFRRLRCAGLQGGALAGFAALHELLHPVLDQVEALPPRQREALLTAFGLQDGPTPERLLIGLAVLGLLEEVAAAQPLLLVVEDAPWLDASSAEVIGFLARRLEGARTLLVATARTSADDADPYDSGTEVLRSAAAARVRLRPLSPEHSEQVLDALAVPGAQLPDSLRRRVLREAGGNPLALREYTSALRAREGDEHGLGDGPLPTTRRLEAAFLSEVAELPEGSRTLLLLAAAGEEASLPQLLTAGAALGVSAQDLTPLERADLVAVVLDRLRFRHPLLRSAVYGAAPVAERAAAHRALAAAVTDSGRAAWHRAAATLERDEAVAAELESAAASAAVRGAGAEAAAALRRAARFSPDAAERVRRLVRAAEQYRQAGLVEQAQSVLREAEPLARTAQQRFELAQVRGMIGALVGGDTDNTAEQFAFARALAGPSGRELPEVRVQVLAAAAYGVVNRTSGDVSVDAATWREVHDELAAVDLGGWNDYQRLGLAVLDPLGQAAEVLPRLPRMARSLTGAMPLFALAQTAEFLQDLTTARSTWASAAEALNRSGSPTGACQAMSALATLRLIAGQVPEAVADAETARRTARDLGLPVVEASAEATLARAHLLTGRPGEAAAALRRSREAYAGSALAQPAANASWSAGLLALHEHRDREALAQLRGVLVHRPSAQWAVADLTEAAVRCGEPGAALDVVAEVEHAARELGSAHLLVLVHRSRAALEPGRAEEHHRSALAAGADGGAPLELARTHLQFGEWLRRERRVLEAREHLDEALRAFEAAGAGSGPHATRAAAELRAAGSVPMGRSTATSAPALTAQELQIARLAAEGLSNKEIADRVYLSHRTVSSHLYKVFPKLGIASRHQLGAALRRLGEHEARDSARSR
ncbi:helix-turn-helix transcriptional regulator [Kineococcus vitellinus]|uniref:helix-turn-helix transcriptional regulator n=1 Tax=Kineococcus vitellinus TaxID=2696565 RepID=UPI0030B82006